MEEWEWGAGVGSC